MTAATLGPKKRTTQALFTGGARDLKGRAAKKK